MKKELVAAVLLALVFACTLLNIHMTDRLMGELDDAVTLAYFHAEDGDWENARIVLENACERWLSLDGYTHVFIRHSEIGTTTDAFYSMLSAVYAKEVGEVHGTYLLLHAQLLSIMGMEHISIGSIF